MVGKIEADIIVGVVQGCARLCKVVQGCARLCKVGGMTEYSILLSILQVAFDCMQEGHMQMVCAEVEYTYR